MRSESAKQNKAAYRTGLVASLMLLAVLLAGSDCQETQVRSSVFDQSGSRTGSNAGSNADPSGFDFGRPVNPDAQNGDDSNDQYENGSYTPDLDDGNTDGGINGGGNTTPGASEGPRGDVQSGGACVNDASCSTGLDCVAGTCVETGVLRISMYWSQATDIDLHILTPSGDKLWYRNRDLDDGGRFESDTCIGGCDMERGAIVESAFWKTPPTHGEYRVWAVNYDGEMAATVNFEILADGVITTFQASVGADEEAESEPISFIYPTLDDRDAGTLLGQFIHTYYYLADETQYSGAATTTLYDSQCRPLAQVSAAFADSACIEGSGKLRDGTIINYARTCTCGRRCPTGGTVCYSALDSGTFPWGKGNRNNPLEPFRSIAVDRNVIANGTVVYIEEWDGITIPSVDGIGGFVHDGCFRADDVGGGIRGNHYDFFAATKDMWRELERARPTRTTSNVYTNSERCAHL